MKSLLKPQASIFLGCIVLQACAGNLQVQPSGYSAPQSQPPLPQSVSLAGSAAATLENAAKQLSQLGFATSTDNNKSILVANYSGRLDDLVDCGTLTAPGESESKAASSAQLSISAFPERPAWKALRQMRLDVRATTQTRPDSGGFRARTDAVYVVTRTIDTVSASGAVLGTDREIISFESGGVGRFENGLTCQPTGSLEIQLTSGVADAATLGGGINGLTPIDEALPVDEPDKNIITTTDLGAEPAIIQDQAPTPSLDLPDETLATAPLLSPGNSSNGESLQDDENQSAAGCGKIAAGDVELLASGGCGLERFSEEIGRRAYPEFEVTVAGGTEGLRAGSPLSLEVSLPGGNRYFHVAYLASDGLVYHAGPKYIDRQGIGERFLYQTGFDLAANDRIELIMAITGTREIFAFERPDSEPAIDFLAVMSERFDNSRDDLAVISIQRPASF